VIENLPNADHEITACDVPAVVFDTGGMGELVQHISTGRLSDIDDVDEFTPGIDTLLKDDDLGLRLGRAGVEPVRLTFFKQSHAQTLSPLNGETLEARGEASATNR
jgi:glycosyltransferase involved in cell wall biosynthesis